MSGDWQRGRELVERALARDPAYSGYCHAVLALEQFSIQLGVA
jgi:hypothetical protein